LRQLLLQSDPIQPIADVNEIKTTSLAKFRKLITETQNE
jgi:hypothetical protein